MELTPLPTHGDLPGRPRARAPLVPRSRGAGAALRRIQTRGLRRSGLDGRAGVRRRRRRGGGAGDRRVAAVPRKRPRSGPARAGPQPDVTSQRQRRPRPGGHDRARPGRHRVHADVQTGYFVFGRIRRSHEDFLCLYAPCGGGGDVDLATGPKIGRSFQVAPPAHGCHSRAPRCGRRICAQILPALDDRGARLDRPPKWTCTGPRLLDALEHPLERPVVRRQDRDVRGEDPQQAHRQYQTLAGCGGCQEVSPLVVVVAF